MQLLLRLEHLFAPGENEETSVAETVSLQQLLSEDGFGLGKAVRSVSEVKLAANQPQNTLIQPPEFSVTIKPFEIRSFIVSLD